MACLEVKKGINKKRSYASYSPLKSLPNELLTEVLAKVASHSISDICRVKLCCKEILRAAEDNYVYQHASMDNFALVPLPWFTNDKERSFLKRCRDSGHSEITYREGMVEYFSSLETNSGLEKLRKASQEGHNEARYVYCMILMCSEDEEQRKQGLNLFGLLRKSTSIKKCRKRVESFIRSTWVNNPFVLNGTSLCHSSTCEKLQKKLSRRWSSLDEDGVSDISCEYCRGDCELRLFCNIFEV